MQSSIKEVIFFECKHVLAQEIPLEHRRTHKRKKQHNNAVVLIVLISELFYFIFFGLV